MKRLLERTFAVEATAERAWAERAWAELVAAERWPRWTLHLRSVKVTPPGPVGPGSGATLKLANRQHRRPWPHRHPVLPGGQGRSDHRQLAKAAPLERLGQPEDVAEAVSFLAGPARWINGQVIYINGGLA